MPQISHRLTDLESACPAKSFVANQHFRVKANPPAKIPPGCSPGLLNLAKSAGYRSHIPSRQSGLIDVTQWLLEVFVRVFTRERSFRELRPVAGRIGPRMDPWQAGLNYLLLLSACFFFVSTNAHPGRHVRALRQSRNWLRFPAPQRTTNPITPFQI